MWDTFLSLISSWAGKTIIFECWDVCVKQHVVIKYYCQVVLSLALPIMKSLKGGRVRLIDNISTISVLSSSVLSARFYTPRGKLVRIVVILTKGANRRERIWETHWFDGTIIYRTLLDNLLEFKKEDCVLVAIKFDTEITTVVNKCKVASILSPFVQVRKSKLEKRNTHHCWSRPETASCRLWHQTSLEDWH